MDNIVEVEDFRKFLFIRQERGDGFYTHTSQIIPTGKYNITRKDTEKFWKIYCDNVYYNKKFVCGLTEKPNEYLPVLADIDIKIPYDESKHSLDKRLYSEEQAKNVIGIYQKFIKQICINYTSKYNICFLLEKEKPYRDNDGNIKNGFHLHFPFTFINKIDQDIHLIPRVRREVEDKDIFKNLVKNSSSVIDKSCTSRFWLLYGSKKAEYLEFYKLTKIFDENLREISLKEVFDMTTLFDIHNDAIPLTENLEYYLPRFLSIHPENKDVVEIKKDLNIITKTNIKNLKEISKKTYENKPISEQLKYAKELLKIISSTRADNYDDWMDLGWVLYNIGDGCQEALELWIEFSSRTNKKNYFSEKFCIYEWERMEKKNKTIGSLRHYAKVDNPEEYQKIVKKETDRLYNSSLNGGHYDMAEIMYNKFRDDFIYIADLDIWYIYKNHRWILDKKGIELKRHITSTLTEVYRKKKEEISRDLLEEDDSTEFQKKIKIIERIIGNLKSNPFKNCILKECQELFHRSDFISKLDMNPNILGFNNGVLDLCELRFREGRPSDYITMSTGYDFPKIEYTWESIEVLEVMSHLEKVFPDPLLKQYFIEYCSSLLKGYNSAKIVLNMTGSGDNGKSINLDLLKLCLGQYMKTLPTSLLFGKRQQSSGATPETANLEGVRLVVLQESNKKDAINTGIMKELSGNDTMYARDLFKGSKEIKPMFKLTLVCNSLPRLSTEDPASWNRIRVLPYESKFPKDDKLVPDTYEEQKLKKIFPRDAYFSEKLPKMKEPFIWILWQTYKKILREGRMKEPEKVIEATAIYKKNNDMYLEFINERIIEDFDNPKANIGYTELYNAYKNWFIESKPNIRNELPNKDEVKEEFTIRWGELTKNHRWKGYRLRTQEDDEKEGKVIIVEVDKKDNEREENNFKEEIKNNYKIINKQEYINKNILKNVNNFNDDSESEYE